MTHLPDMYVVVKGDIIEREHLVVNGEITEPTRDFVVYLTQELVKGGLTLRNISDALDIHYDTLSKWRSGERVPRRWIWCALLRLAVNRDVLRKQLPDAAEDLPKSAAELRSRLKELHSKKVPLHKIAKSLGMSLETAYREVLLLSQ